MDKDEKRLDGRRAQFQRIYNPALRLKGRHYHIFDNSQQLHLYKRGSQHKTQQDNLPARRMQLTQLHITEIHSLGGSKGSGLSAQT